MTLEQTREGPATEESADIAVVGEVAAMTGTPCAVCGTKLCGHQALFSIILGFKNAACCLPCFARHLEQSENELRAQLGELIQRRDCYRQAWDAASRREGFAPGKEPGCLSNTQASSNSAATVSEEDCDPHNLPVEDQWNAGDMGCGDLVLALRIRLQKLAPGNVLKVTAYDPAAPLDLPAWCRLTGHRMVQAAHPEYYIERKRG